MKTIKSATEKHNLGFATALEQVKPPVLQTRGGIGKTSFSSELAKIALASEQKTK